MRNVLIEMKNLSDSREILEAKPNKFFYIFVFLLISLITATIIWTYLGEMDVYVKTEGIIRPIENINSVRNLLTGKVEEVHIEEGVHVNSGDILYTINSEDMDIQLEKLYVEKTELEQELAYLKRYRDSIESGKNLFGTATEREAMYNTLVEKHRMNVNIANKQLNEEKENNQQLKNGANLSLEETTISLEKSEVELANLEKYRNSLLEGKNLFSPNDSFYFNKFKEYEAKLNNLNLAAENAKRVRDANLKLYDSGVASKNEVEISKAKLESSLIAIDELKQVELSSTEKSIDTLKSDIKNIGIAVEKAKNSIETYSNEKESSILAIESTELQLLTQIDEQIKAEEGKFKGTEQSIKELELRLKQTVIKAVSNGKINMKTTISPGELLENGTEVATIVPESGDKLRVEMVVVNADIGQVKLGQEVEFKLLALPYQDFGTVRGIVSKIGTDVRIDSKSNQKYYLVESYIENRPIENDKGEIRDIKVGMVVEGKIISGSEKIFNWIMKKLDFMD